MKSQSDYEELIKAGKLDITTREAVENEADHEARKAEPGEYALTYLQHVLLLRAANTITTVLLKDNKTTTDTTTGEKFNVIDDATAQKIRREWRKRNIRIDRLENIVSVLHGDYYMLCISTAYHPPINSPGFSLFACVDGMETGGFLSYENFPQIYDQSSRKEQREALGLPDKVKYLFTAEKALLEQIAPLIVTKQSVAPHIPKDIVILKDKITHKYLNNEYEYDNGVRTTTRTPSAGEKKDDMPFTFVTRTTASLEHLPAGATLGGKFTVTKFHNDVFNAIISFCADCKNWPLTLYDGGICEHIKISNTQENRDKVNEVMLNFGGDWLTIDSASTSEQFGFERKKISDNVVSFLVEETIIPTKDGTTTVRKYYIKNIPILLYYNTLMRNSNGASQILRLPRSVLARPQELDETEGKKRATSYNTQANRDLKMYLAQRVKAIPAISNVILYETIFDELGITGDTASARNKKSDTRKHVRQILNTFKKEKLIKGWYEETPDGKRITIDKNGNAPRGTVSRAIIVTVWKNCTTV